MIKTNSDTMDKVIERDINAVKKTYQNRLTGEPKKSTLKAGNGNTLQSITFSYSAKNGSATYDTCNYFEEIAGQYVKWSFIVVKGDDTSFKP